MSARPCPPVPDALRPTLLLAGACVDAAWLGAQALTEASRAPGWLALTRQISSITRGTTPPPADWTGAPLAAGTDRRDGAHGLPDPGHESWLRTHFGWPSTIAVAAATAWADGQPRAAWRLDPVHLHVGRDQLVLTPPMASPLPADEAAQLAAAIAPLLAEEGLTLTQPTPKRWYLLEADPQRALQLSTRPLNGAIGRRIDAWLPSGLDARRWKRVLNEIQMTWFTHPVNEARQQRGALPINSVWLEGRVPPPETPSLASVAQAWLANSGTSTDTLLDGAPPIWLETRLLEALHRGDPQEWSAIWRTLDTEIFAPLAGLSPTPPRVGALTRIVLTGDTGWQSLELSAPVPPGWRGWLRRYRFRRRAPDSDTLLAAPAAPA